MGGKKKRITSTVKWRKWKIKNDQREKKNQNLGFEKPKIQKMKKERKWQKRKK